MRYGGLYPGVWCISPYRNVLSRSRSGKSHDQGFVHFFVVGVANEDIKGNESGNVFLGGNFVYSTKSQNKFRGRAKHCLQNLTLVAWRMRWILEYLDIIWLP